MGWTRRTFVAGFPRVGYSFGVGLLLYRYSSRLPALGLCRTQPVLTAILLLLLVAGTLAAQPSGWLSLVWDCTAAFVVFPILIYIGMQIRCSDVARQLLAYLGMASYTIYIIHKPLYDLITTIIVFVHRTDIYPALTPWAGIGFASFLLAISFPLDRYYDQPIRRRLGWKPRHRPEAT